MGFWAPERRLIPLRSFYAIAMLGVNLRKRGSLPPTQCSEDRLENPVEVGPDLGLPETQDRPASLLEEPVVLPIPVDVAPDLGEPVGGVRPAAQLPASLLPIPPMPEIAITENGESRSQEDHIRPS